MARFFATAVITVQKRYLPVWALIFVPWVLLGPCGCTGQQEGPPMQLVIMGPPGAGKGTQAKKVHEKLGIAHISTGAILRDEVAYGTELGNKVKDIMERGDLVDDETILRLVEGRLQEPDCADGFILDGFPRTVAQAEGLDVILGRQKRGDVYVIYLQVPDDALVERLLKRKRADDTRETITNRIAVFHEETAPLIGYYEKRGKLVRINGNQSIDGVFATIDELLSGRP
jgi:adenylate kinase